MRLLVFCSIFLLLLCGCCSIPSQFGGGNNRGINSNVSVISGVTDNGNVTTANVTASTANNSNIYEEQQRLEARQQKIKEATDLENEINTALDSLEVDIGDLYNATK